MLQEWLQSSDQDLDGAYFYSDSVNDLPLLEKVDHPTAFTPTRESLFIAERRKPAILEL